MEKSIDLKFCFKGNRTYVQGPDIFDNVVENLKKLYDISKIHNIRYAAHSMLHTNATMTISNKKIEKINSLIRFLFENKIYYVNIIGNNKNIDCKIDYSEDVVQNTSLISDKIIKFKNILNYSFSEIIVSMNKYYLQETITQEGKWIVTQFDYNNLVDIQNTKNKTIKLILLNNFNNKLTKSEVFVDDKSVGYIYFSLV